MLNALSSRKIFKVVKALFRRYNKWDKSQKGRQTPYDITLMWNIRAKTNEQRKQNKNTHT